MSIINFKKGNKLWVNKFKSFGLVLKRLISSVYPPAQKGVAWSPEVYHSTRGDSESDSKFCKRPPTTLKKKQGTGNKEQGPQGTRATGNKTQGPGIKKFFLIIYLIMFP